MFDLFDQPDRPSKRGYLEKKTKNWQRRYFVTEGTTIYYYKDERGGKPKGSIDLIGCALWVEGPQSIIQEDFFIQPIKGKKFQIRAETAMVARDWIDIIKRLRGNGPGDQIVDFSSSGTVTNTFNNN